MITINVTKNDCKDNRKTCKGRTNRCSTCPIACAVSRRLKPQFSAEVTPHSIRIINKTAGFKGDILWYDLTPLVGQRAIELFDARYKGQEKQHVAPFKFDLDIPKKFLK